MSKASALKGKSLIITGGASGIGQAAVRLAAGAGARVTIADLNQAAGGQLVEEIQSAGGEAQFIRTNIADEEQVKAMVSVAVSRYGRLDGAFNNAGIPGYSHQGTRAEVRFAEIPFDEFKRVVDVNVCGTFLCMKYEIMEMLKTGGGSIVNTSSVAGCPDYVSSKHGVVGLTKSGALDYAARNIRVNAVLPGVIRTPMVDTSFGNNPHMHDWAAQGMPNKRLGEPAEVAEAALWLLSDAASLVTGISMSVDGGYSIV